MNDLMHGSLGCRPFVDRKQPLRRPSLLVCAARASTVCGMFGELERGFYEVVSDEMCLDAPDLQALARLNIDGALLGQRFMLGAVVQGREQHVARIAYTLDDTVAAELSLERACWLLDHLLVSSAQNAKLSNVLGLASKEADDGSSAASALLAEAASPDLDPSVDPQLVESKSGPSPSPKRKAKAQSAKAAAAANALKTKSISFGEARTVTPELLALLESGGQEAHAGALGFAGVLSVRALQLHTVAELEQSLRRPVAYGARFKLSDREQSAFRSMGVGSSATAQAQLETNREPLAGPLIFGDALLGGQTEKTRGGMQLEKQFENGKGEIHAEVLEGCTFAGRLLGSVGTDLDAGLCSEVLELVASATQSKSSKPKANTALPSLIDGLDLLLEQLVDESRLSLNELDPPSSGSRAAAKHARKLAMKLEGTRRPQDGGGGGHLGDGSAIQQLSRVLTVSNTPRLSEKDEKVAEELAASQTRVDVVSRDPKSLLALKCLAELMESKDGALQKMESFSHVMTEFGSVAAVIKSSHVKEPRGEFLAACPHADMCVKYTRVVRNGVKTAAKEIMRNFLPSSAECSSMVEAVLSGVLVGEGACSVTTLANPAKPKVWLGLAGVPASEVARASSRSSLLVVMLKALPLLGYALSVLQPEDGSIPITMMEVMSAFARGVAARTVQEAIDGILVPFFRAYGDAFERFQKSASVEAPCMADAWAAEKPQPTVQAFLTLVAQAEAVAAAGGTPAATNSTGDAVSASKLRELENRVNRKLESLTSKTQQLSKAMSDAESGDEESPSARTLTNREKNKAKKERQKAAKAAREGAAPGSAAPRDGQ